MVSTAPDIASSAVAAHKMLAPGVDRRVVAVVNQKGGVGKTTTAINLGAAMAERGRQVLLVDLDPQANATSGVGLDPSSPHLSVYHLLSGEAALDEVARPTPMPGLYIVPSELGLAGAEVELATLPDRELRLRRALSELDGGFGEVLIDCPPSLGLLTLNALAAAGRMVIPLQAEYFALEGLANLLQTHQRVRAGLNPDLELGGILLTLFDGRTTLAWDVLHEVRRAYPELVFRTLIPRNIRLGEAPSHGLPVLLYDPACRGSVAYRQLAEEVLA